MAYSRSHANRGAFLERVIDMANNKYRSAGVADIRKVPTPVKILNRTGNRVTGHLEKPVLVDYVGIYNGDTIIFDAKQTALTNFPLDNLSDHQYNLLESWSQKGAVAFLVVYFSKYDKYYYLPFATLKWAVERANAGGRKSIAHKEFETMAAEVKSKDGYALHYLGAV